MEITMRLIRKNDISVLIDICNSVIESNPMSLDIDIKTENFILKKLSRHSKRYPIYIGETVGKPVCWLSFKRFDEDYPFDNVAVLEMCIDNRTYVDGLEKSLVSFAEQQAEALGYTKVITYIINTNQPIIKIFRSAGYRDVGILKKHGYKKGNLIDFIMLEKIINTKIDDVNKYYRENYDFYDEYFTTKENNEIERMTQAGMVRSPDDPYKWYFPMEEKN